MLRDKDVVKVESPKRLPDRTTGKLREHDVILTMTTGHHTLRVAIECRDRSRPVGVPEVEAFWAKCQDTGVQQGIIVSPRGFRASGQKKAKHYGIRCLSLEEAESFNWLLAPGFQYITCKLLGQEWRFVPETDGLVSREHMEVLGPDGTKIDPAVLSANAQRFLNDFVPREHGPCDLEELRLRVPTNGFTLRDSETGATTPTHFAYLKLTYSITHELIPLRLSQYKDKDGGEHITDVAVADFRIGDKTASLMIVMKPNEGGQVVFVPHPSKDT
ncbi:MAG: restriction endonuclease [Gammaproteobacteria bacterium]|nr:restriction endonuclease [Gammaproteobacteria bacterium]